MAPDGHVSVHALSAGVLTLPMRAFVAPLDDPDEMMTVPSLSFLIQHKDPTTSKTTRIIFDLGIRRDLTKYPELLQRRLAQRQPTHGTPDVTESLARGGLKPNDIDFIIYSHVHWDHIGMPSDFPSSRFVVGPKSIGLLLGTAPADEIGNNTFEPDLLSLDRIIELHCYNEDPIRNPRIPAMFTQAWEQLDLLPHTMDIFSDGSVRIVSSPGHLLGHINLLCRLENGRYVYLGGDACHDKRLMTGEKEIATWPDKNDPTVLQSIHNNIEVAQQTIQRIAKLGGGETSLGPVEVILAHDGEWEQKAKKENRFWPGKL